MNIANMVNIDKMILEAAISLLQEETPPESDPKAEPAGYPGSKIRIKGSLGRGTWKKEVKIAESRAKSEPKLLCAELGISRATGSNDLAKAASIITQAINGNEIMSEAFTGISSTGSAFNKEEQQVSGIEVNHSLPTRRDAVKYLYITLLAAERARLLDLDKGVGFSHYELVTLPTIYAID